MLDIQNLHQYRENNRIEAKEALGGLPDKSLHALDLLDPQWLIDDFWAIINDPREVSVNILTEESVAVHQVDGKRIIAITVPEARACDKPVYLKGDPYRETYRRNGEGDYRCSRDEVEEFFRKATE